MAATMASHAEDPGHHRSGSECSSTSTLCEEGSPLLKSFPLSPVHLTPSPASLGQLSAAEQAAKRLRFRVTLLIIALIICVDLPGMLQSNPMVRIMEDIFCRKYYQGVDAKGVGAQRVIEESLCKGEMVQGELAGFRGWMSTLDHLPGLFLAVPFGILADKYGRKWLMVMNVIVIQLRCTWMFLVCLLPHILPMKAMWLQSILSIFGGGSMVATSLIFVMISDVTPKAEMASTFFRLSSANYLCFLIGPPLAAWLMAKNPWLPFTLGIFLQAIAIPVTFAMPETLGARKVNKDGHIELDADVEPLDLAGNDEACRRTLHLKQPGTIFRALKSVFMSLVTNSAFLLSTWRIPFFLSIYPFRMLMSALDSLLLQYISKRYDWPFSAATNIYSVLAGASMLVLLFLLPWFSSFLQKKRGYSTSRKDVLLTRLGLTAFAAGLLVTGLASSIGMLVTGLVIGALGSGVGSAMRALLTSWVKPNEVARLYSALSIVETAGMTVGGPICAGLFGVGMNWATGRGSHMWLGLPWMVVGLLSCILVVLIWVVRFGDKRADLSEDKEEESQWSAENR